MSAPKQCPHCQTSMQGAPIAAEHLIHAEDCPKLTGAERCYCLPYGEGTTHFSRVMGHEVRGVYDGILYWSCPDCHLAWPRFNDGLGHLSVAAAEYVWRHNGVVQAVSR